MLKVRSEIHMVFALVFAIGVVACAGTQLRREPLGEAVRAYHDGLRWQRYASSAAYLSPLERETFLDERDALDEELRINHYEISRVRFVSGGTKGEVQVKYIWYMDNEGVVRKTTSMQNWERVGSSWRLIEERHVRGDEMPGVPDSPTSKPGADSIADPLDTRQVDSIR